MVTTILDSAFSKMKNFLTRFQPILEIYWRNKLVNLEILVNERLANPIESIQNTLKLFDYYKKMFGSQIPTTAPIGLIQLDTKSARQKIQPTAEAYITQINKFIPQVLKERCQETKDWLKKSINALNKPPGTVSDFVEQTKQYNIISDEFQAKRDRMDMINQIYGVFAEMGLKVEKADKDSFSEGIKSISELQNIVQ